MAIFVRRHIAKRRRAARNPAVAPARQMDLELPEEGTLDQRIAWCKATAGNYEEMASKEENPELRARFERRAALWGKKVLDLIDERARTNSQLDLFGNP